MRKRPGMRAWDRGQKRKMPGEQTGHSETIIALLPLARNCAAGQEATIPHYLMDHRKHKVSAKPGRERQQNPDMIQQELPLDEGRGALQPGAAAQELMPVPEMSLHDLREWHRVLSDRIIEVQRLIKQLSHDGEAHDDPRIQALRDRSRSLQAERAAVDEEIEGERLKASLEDRRGAGLGQQERKALRKQQRDRGLLPVRHPNRDFFLADLFDYALKDDGATMEAPIFTLATKPDLSIWEWRSKDSSKYVKVTPSVLGRATQYDKDILIYVISQLIEGLNREREDAQNRTVRFTVHDFLVSTNRPTGGSDYKRLHETFERLRGTSISTDIKTSGERIREGFGIIDAWRIIEKSPVDERMIAVEVTLSRWLYNAVQAFEVLTIHPDYFRLRKPLARRLYEIARKHCGHQPCWRIGLELLQKKTGSRSSLREFRRALRAIEDDKSMPQYEITLGDDDIVSFKSIQGRPQFRG